MFENFKERMERISERRWVPWREG